MAAAVQTTVLILLFVTIILCDESGHPRRRPTLDKQMKFHPSEQITSSSDNIQSPPLRWLPINSPPQVMSTAHASYNPLDYNTTPKANIVVNYFNSQQHQVSPTHNQDDAFGTLADASNAEEYVKAALKMRNHNVKHGPATSENHIHTATFTASNAPIKSNVKPKKYIGTVLQHSAQEDALQGNSFLQQSLNNFHKQMEDWKNSQTNLKASNSDNWNVPQHNQYRTDEGKNHQQATTINVRPHQSYDNVLQLDFKENSKIFDQHVRQIENLGASHNSNHEDHLYKKQPLIWNMNAKPNYETKQLNHYTQIPSYSSSQKQQDIPGNGVHHPQNMITSPHIVSLNTLPIPQALTGEVPGFRSLEYSSQSDNSGNLHQSHSQNHPLVSYQTLPVKDNYANVGASISVGQQLMKSEGPHGPITVINGLPIVNPYKIDLQTLRSMIGNTNDDKHSNPLQNIQDFQRENNYQVHEPKTENNPVQNDDNSGQYGAGVDHQGSQGQYSHLYSNNSPFTPVKFNWEEASNHRGYKPDLQGSYSMNSKRIAASGNAKSVVKKKQKFTGGKNDSTRNLPSLHTELRPPPLNN